jgi:hypothetical protein
MQDALELRELLGDEVIARQESGALHGTAALPGHWVDPLHDTIRSAVVGFDNAASLIWHGARSLSPADQKL